ncbi:hypothetical protein [Paenibacillus ehimensis]|uniref:Uncharacterized protein n=1 Tax=Paenibacillus ehimensis TaxID=79264 RepID=A0ABT8VI36_9BACL|nr:hypothetical protein [Paenibacillus ehimensis]MDO3680631.1 hypothetical protein [Paenibacillus ehimensis]
MGFKVNNGHAFLHPASGLFIGPGDIYFEDDPTPLVEEASAEKLLNQQLSLEQFTELKASEQKSFLQSLNIDLGSNESQRIENYAAWLKAKETAGNVSEPIVIEPEKGAAEDGSDGPIDSAESGDRG